MRNKWKLVVGLVLMACVSSGCKKLVRELIGEAAEGLAIGGSGEEKAVDLYVDGFNVLVDDAVPCSEAYLKSVPEQGPEPGKRYMWIDSACTSADNELASLQEKFKAAEADASDAMREMVAHADAAVTNLQTLIKADAETKKYYDSAAYKTDNGAQGKVLHGRMQAASDAFRKSLVEFESDLSIFEEKKASADLERYSADKNYSYWLRKATRDANQLLKVKASDTAAFERARTEFQTASTPFKAFVDGKGTSLNASFKGFVGAYDAFDSAASRFLVSAKEQANPPQLEQAYRQLVSQYNAMVSIGNSLRELESRDLLK